MGCGASATAGPDASRSGTHNATVEIDMQSAQSQNDKKTPATLQDLLQQPSLRSLSNVPTTSGALAASSEALLPVPITCHEHPLVPFDNGSTTWFCDNPCKECARDTEGPKARWKCPSCNFDQCRACVEFYRIKVFCRGGHVLKALGTTRDNGWNCDGRDDPGGCCSGIKTGGVQSKGLNRFRCTECDFDLCEACWKARQTAGSAAPLPPTSASPLPPTLERAFTVEKICPKGHKLFALGTSRDNGWACDGRFFAGGCKSGITGMRQSKGLNRYRCDSCDYDLCEKCLPSAPNAPTSTKVDESEVEKVVELLSPPKHWDLSVMKKIEMRKGLRPLDGINTNLFGKVPLGRDFIRNLQELISASYRKVYTRDRKGGRVPDSLQLVRGFRTQNAQSWNEYSTRTEAIRQHLITLRREGSPGVCPNGHALVPLGLSRDNGKWTCDGKDEKEGCESGIATAEDAKGMNRFRCHDCDYDLCEKCYLMRTGQKLCNFGHVLVPLGTSRDTGWFCNATPCRRGITSDDKSKSKGVNRFRCEECDWDLCDRCHMIHMGQVNSSVGGLRTEHDVMNCPEFKLPKESNCVWLFHGTSDAAGEAITTGDFLLDKAGTNAGTLYGRGIYLAESCSKADEYTMENEEGLRCLLLCRATLGNVLYNCELAPNVDRLVRQCVRGTFHSVLGDREKIRGTYREFIVYDDDQVYPEYILWYRRLYAKR